MDDNFNKKNEHFNGDLSNNSYNENLQNKTPEQNIYEQNAITPQNDGFMTYQQERSQPISHQQMSANEVAYYPNPTTPPKKKSKKEMAQRILKSIAFVTCIVVISGGTLFGYAKLAQNGYGFSIFGNHLYSEKSKNDNSAENNDSSDNSNGNKNSPSLLQQAGLENALSIPDIVEKVSPSVVGISCKMPDGTATGTGIIMTEDGYIITNGHVVDTATEITVVISKGEEFEETTAKLIGIDLQTDLAVLKVEKEGLPPAEFGKSSELKVGELAIAIGNPLGFELAGSVTGGIISALNRELIIENVQLTLIQTDAAINPGNSGGPLVNSYGQVIGINSAKISSSYAEGLGFAIPLDEAKPIIDNLIAFGFVKGRPMLGISGEVITDVEARYYSLPEGIIIRFIEPNSGAEKAGLKLGDIIIGVDGKSIKTMSELNKIKESHKAGETVKLAVYRDGKNMDIDVVLSEATQEK